MFGVESVQPNAIQRINELPKTLTLSLRHSFHRTGCQFSSLPLRRLVLLSQVPPSHPTRPATAPPSPIRRWVWPGHSSGCTRPRIPVRVDSGTPSAAAHSLDSRPVAVRGLDSRPVAARGLVSSGGCTRASLFPWRDLVLRRHVAGSGGALSPGVSQRIFSVP